MDCLKAKLFNPASGRLSAPPTALPIDPHAAFAARSPPTSPRLRALDEYLSKRHGFFNDLLSGTRGDARMQCFVVYVGFLLVLRSPRGCTFTRFVIQIIPSLRSNMKASRHDGKTSPFKPLHQIRNTHTHTHTQARGRT